MPTGLPASVTISAVIFEESRMSSAGKQVAANRLPIFCHHLIDQRGHQAGRTWRLPRNSASSRYSE
jgi:hypothetical protein